MLLGIDPGIRGGVALISDYGEYMAGTRMPSFKVSKKRRVIDVEQIHQFVNDNRGWGKNQHLEEIMIEYVHAMPGQGVTSMFNFGLSVGAVEAWAMSYPANTAWVTPQVWKKHFGLDKDKRASLEKCRQLFGERDGLWDVLANDGIAEASLIALYAQRTLIGART